MLQSLRVVTGDVRDPNGVRRAVAGQDIVFHLAALIGIPFSYEPPDTYVDTKIGTDRLAENFVTSFDVPATIATNSEIGVDDLAE